MKTASPRYRMVAIDLDGTLLDPLGRVSPASKAAVHRALQAGLLVVFATGRNWTESQTVLEAVAHYDTAVFVGGAMVVDTQNRITLHRTLMDPALARELCADLESAGQAVLAMQDASDAGVDYLVTDRIELDAHLLHWLSRTTTTIERVSDLATRDHAHTVRIGAVISDANVQAIHRLLDGKYAERAFYHFIRVPSHGVEVIEVFDPSVNKWEGISQVARQHGIAPEQIITIGDDINDVHMIRNAGLGVAMGNAIPAIKQIARRVIAPNSEDGLAAFLNEIVDTHLVEPQAEEH